MSFPAARCPVCQNADEAQCDEQPSRNDARGFDCDRCGNYEISRTAFDDEFEPSRARLTKLHRAAISHRLRSTEAVGDPPMITTDWLRHFKRDPSLPSHSSQALNIVRAVGDHVRSTGEGYVFNPSSCAIVGSIDQFALHLIRKELEERRILKNTGQSTWTTRRGGNVTASMYGLTLDGWDKYESEQRGMIAGHFGFIAMKFGDDALESLVSDIVKPLLFREIGYEIVDMRNVARAGIIDNIMRAQIRDAAFVIVDLTHDNAGAYWEAGYAEGLGKPVVYICELRKFEDAPPHFDANHCTTVLWSKDSVEQFGAELVATLRRSLNLFPRK